MEDLSEKLAGILNDPESMDQVRRMAENLMGASAEGTEEASALNTGTLLSTLTGDSADAPEIKKITGLINLFKGHNDDKRTALLTALRPLLSEPRQIKLDTALKILRLIDMLPAIKESGVFNL